MLANEKAMTMDFTPRNVWENGDWDRIASELQSRYPDWRSRNFSMSEFEDAMETVIAQEHHRAFMSMEDVTPHLFMAFARRSPGKAPPTTKKNVPKVIETVTGAIRWAPEEWESVVLELHSIEPTFFADRLAKLSFPIIRAAQSHLPSNRRRDPNQIELYRKQLLKTWDALPADVRDPRLQDRKIVDFPSGPVMQPPRQKSDNASAIALAMHKGFQDPEKPKAEPKTIKLGKVKQKRNYYSAEDWLDIAREMYRQNPHAPYFTSAFQTVDLPALRAAQRVMIPIERRRTITGNYGLAKPLVAAFKALKQEMEEDAAKAIPEPVLPVAEAVPGSTVHSDGVLYEYRAPEPPVPAQVEEIAESSSPRYVLTQSSEQATPTVSIAPSAAPTDFLSRIIAASKPLINVIVAEFRQDIAAEVAKILLPQITGALSPMLDTAVQGVKDAIAAQFNPWSTSGLAQSSLPIATPDYQHGAQAADLQPNHPPSELMSALTGVKQVTVPIQKFEIPVMKPVEKPKKLKIAIIGPRGGQQEQVIRAFPEFDFVFIENGHGIKEAGTSCALFIASNAYLNRANQDTMKAHVPPEKVRFIDGGMSTIKRTINVWKATNPQITA